MGPGACEIANFRKISIPIFQEFLASIEKIFKISLFLLIS